MLITGNLYERRPTKLTYVSNNSVTSTNTTYTFSAQSLGSMVDRRWILVGACGGQSSGSKSITGITIDGSAMSQIFSDVTTAGQDPVALFALQWPTGTTGDIAVTFNASMARCAIVVYTMSTDFAPTTVFDDQVDKTLSGSDLSVTVNVPALGAGLALGLSTLSAGSASATWTGFTEDVDIGAGSTAQGLTGASLGVINQQSVTTTVTFAGTLISNRCFLRTVTFR